MRKKAYLIIDIGTGNTRAAVITTDGEMLSVCREDSAFYEDHDFPMSICFEPAVWEKTIFRLAEQAITEADADIIAVSASAMRQGIVMIGKDGESLLGCPNSDMRGLEYLDEMDWDGITEITGLAKDAFYSCPKVVGTKKKQPQIGDKIATYTSINDWIGYLFTGKIVYERSQTGQTLVYDIRTDKWSEEMCRMVGVSYDELPPIALAGTILGDIKTEIREALDLKEGVPFVVGASDTQAACVGVQAEKGDLVAVNGTTTPLCMILDHYRKVPYWISPHAVAGEYMFELNCGGTGINVQRFKDKMLPQYSYEELEKASLAKGTMPKVIAMFSEQWSVPEEFCRHVGFLFEEEIDMMLEPCDFLMAMQLDVGFQIANNVQRMEEIEPTGKNYILGCGGGFRGTIAAQAFADISGKELLLPKGYDQGTMYGIVHLCNQAMGIAEPEREIVRHVVPAGNDLIREYYRKWSAYRDKMTHMNELHIL